MTASTAGLTRICAYQVLNRLALTIFSIYNYRYFHVFSQQFTWLGVTTVLVGTLLRAAACTESFKQSIMKASNSQELYGLIVEITDRFPIENQDLERVLFACNFLLAMHEFK
jgi:hypothetical protein